MGLIHRMLNTGVPRDGLIKRDLGNKTKETDKDLFKLTYAEIENIAGTRIDHSFLIVKRVD